MRMSSLGKKGVSALITIAGESGFRELPNYPVCCEEFLYKRMPPPRRMAAWF